MLVLGIAIVTFVVLYIKRRSGGDTGSADYWSWFANQPLQTILLIRTLVVVGLLTSVMGLMLGTYRH